MPHKSARLLLMVLGLLLSSGCHGSQPRADHNSQNSVNAIFVYTTDSAVVAVSDSLDKRVLYRGKLASMGLGSTTDRFLTADSQYLVIRTDAGKVLSIDVRTKKTSSIACECRFISPKPGAGSDIYWLSQDNAIQRLTLGSPDAKPQNRAQPESQRCVGNDMDGL